MTRPLAFISYDFNRSEDERAHFIAEIPDCSQPFNVDDWSLQRQSPRKDWDKIVHGKIGRCDLMVVLVADGMDTAAVAEEIVEAKRCNVPFFGVYVGGARPGTELPAGLPENRTIPRDWQRIAAAIGQVMKEGKHHVFA